MLAKKIKSSGGIVAIFYDDDLFLMSSQLYQDRLNMKIRAYCIENILKISNIVLSPNKHLAQKYSLMQNSQRFAIVPTHIVISEDLNIYDNKKDDNKIKIVYPATNDKWHVGFFRKYVLPDMPKICEDFRQRISFTFIGVEVRIPEFEGITEINYVENMPLAKYRKFMEENKFDIGIAPLDDDEWSKCKYWNKYLEYTISGVAGIYSNVEPYTLIVKNGEDGLLVQNSPGAWYDAIKQLIENFELRKNIIKNAQENVLKNFSLEKITQQLLIDIPEIENFSAKRKKCKSIFFEKIILRFLFLYYFYVVFYAWKKYGFKFVMKKISERLKRKFSA